MSVRDTQTRHVISRDVSYIPAYYLLIYLANEEQNKTCLELCIKGDRVETET